jgi:NSS family neurotransmitter:Na+ symporter
LLARAVTLPGAGDGLALYLVPEWAALADPQLWLAAFSQTFFSFSLAFGVMIAYGALNREDTEVTQSVLMIAGGNLLVSIRSGFGIFGTLGYMAQQTGTAITEVVAGGPSLAFVVFPKAISLLPAFNALIAILFFGTLLLLALDSAFSILESVAKVFQDRFPNTTTAKITFVVSILGFLGGIIFSTGAGLYVLDIVDHFVLNYGLVAVALMECIAVGWIWKGSELRDFINKHSNWKVGISWDIAIKVIAPLFLVILLGWNVYTEFQEPYEGYPIWALLWLGVVPLILTPFIAWLLDWLTGDRGQ